MYHPQPQPSPPASPGSIHAPLPVRSAGGLRHHQQPPLQTAASSSSSRASQQPHAVYGRGRSPSSASSLDSVGSTGALVGNSSSSGLGFGDGGRRGASSDLRRADDMVEILLPNHPSASSASTSAYPPAAHHSRQRSWASVSDDDLGTGAGAGGAGAGAGAGGTYAADDPTPTPGSYAAFARNPAQHAAYARGEYASEQQTYALHTPSLAPSATRSYAPSVASSIGGRSVFDREGGWAQGGGGGPLSRSMSQTSSFAGSELAEKFDYTSWDLSDPTHAHAAAEPDDWLHDAALGAHSRGSVFTRRGLANLGCLALLTGALFMLFAGYPIISVVQTTLLSSNGAFNLGGVNGTGQVPAVIGDFGLIDPKTPESAMTRTGVGGAGEGVEFELVFSDEFETEGRSFYPGDDPYWEAANLHYWATNNLEWYDPRMVTTANGSLVITLEPADPATNHDLGYMGGMLSTWNKFCFTGGYIETSVRLPGSPQVWGLWPAVWTLGNLGRAGYGATLDGMWPYTYENSCDLGTLQNQTLDGLPEAALTTGAEGYNYTLSYLPGQRLSACTCASDPTHPGPSKSGQFVGRGAPEIDIIEAQVDATLKEGKVSMSAQWAPFDASYQWNNASDNYIIYDTDLTELNGYKGGITQEAASGIVTTDQEAYQYPLSGGTGVWSVYGFEYQPSNDAYITWVSNSVPAWTIYQAALGPNNLTDVAERQIPSEPMYIIANLGISTNFGDINYAGLEDQWPVKMEIDWIRVYQRTDMKNIGCDPSDRPTAAYIDQHLDLYSNPNLTTYADGGYVQPLNKLQLKSEGKSC